MNRRILLQATAPAVVIGLLLFGACIVSAWYINRLQTKMAEIMSHNVASLHAAKQLEISLGQMRFHCLLYLLDPKQNPDLLLEIEAYEQSFKDWLERAREAATTEEEFRHIDAIDAGYRRYRKEFDEAQKEALRRNEPLADYRNLPYANPVRYILEPCQKLFNVNEKMMLRTSRESDRLSEKLRLTLVLLGLGGPISGLIMGYGIARGLSKSIYQLSVHVQDMAQRLDEGVASVRVVADGDIDNLDKHLQHVVGRVEEVTARLQLHHWEMIRAQQLSAVGQLAASVAHEVRNPLTSVKMLVEAALRTRNPKPFTRDNLEVIHNEVVRLEHTVQGFLDFARPPKLQLVDVDFRGVVAQAVELVRARARQQRVVIDSKSADEPVMLHVDPSQFCNVLVNLFINALDAMTDGGHLEVLVKQRIGDGVQITVCDTGAGIPEDMSEQLFTPFASTKATGTGLGLSISQRIVKDHGGKIGAHNRPEGGACVTITLPASNAVPVTALVAKV